MEKPLASTTAEAMLAPQHYFHRRRRLICRSCAASIRRLTRATDTADLLRIIRRLPKALPGVDPCDSTAQETYHEADRESHASTKLLACSDPASIPDSNNELPFPRSIIAPPGVAEIAACTSVLDANCALLNSIMSCTGLNPPIVCAPSTKLVNTNSSGVVGVATNV